MRQSGASSLICSTGVRLARLGSLFHARNESVGITGLRGGSRLFSRDGLFNGRSEGDYQVNWSLFRCNRLRLRDLGRWKVDSHIRKVPLKVADKLKLVFRQNSFADRMHDRVADAIQTQQPLLQVLLFVFETLRKITAQDRPLLV